MTNETATETSRERLNLLLKQLENQGINQTQAAVRAKVPTSYLNDVKLGRRSMTELFSRRLAEEFHCNYRWLLGIEPATAQPRSGNWVPVFDHVVEGDPQSNPQWDGSALEIAGAAAAKLVSAIQPYVLRIGHSDIKGRICKGDVLLISQTPNPNAEISIVCHRKKHLLVRSNKSGGNWIRIATGEKLPGECPVVGHCVGVVWAPLCAES